MNLRLKPMRNTALAMAAATAARLAVATALALTGACAVAVEPGQWAPDIDLPAGQVAQRLSELRGKLVYVDFWASWCGPCRLSFPWMNDMQRKYGPKGLQVVAINLDAKRADADAFLARHPAAFALAFDPAGVSARRFGVLGMPSSVLIGPDGRVLYVHRGFRLDDRAELEARLAAPLGGKTP